VRTRPAVLIVAALLSSLTAAPAHATGFTTQAAVSVTEAYGPDPQQVVTVSRPSTATGKTVIFIHGGGWSGGDRGSLAAEAAEWAKTGWVSINMDYRTGTVNGTGDDGANILADVSAVLARYRVMPYVDPARIVVYGESAGGHLATWLGSFKGAQIAATMAISPVSSISGAIIAGQASGAPENVRVLGATAEEYFGYSVGTTDAHRYLDRAKNMFIAFSTDEWVDPDVHGRALCTSLAATCTVTEYPGTRHAGDLADSRPQLRLDARHWADTQL
jgi:acetyl esterase/lipase